MINDDLIQLSFEQLEEIQNRISQAILDKRSARISAAIKDVLYLLNTHYSDISLWDFLNELSDVYQESELVEASISVDLSQPTDSFDSRMDSEFDSDWTESCPEESIPDSQWQVTSQPSAQQDSKPESSLGIVAKLKNASRSQDEDVLLLYDPEIFYERLRVIRNEALQHEDARLLWLTNDGSQKTSKVSGKALAELLQETIKKLERLCDTENEIDIETLNREVLRISEWSEFHLGVSLLRGTLTVIAPFATRDLPVKGYSSMLTIADMQRKNGKSETHVPFSQYR